MTEVKCRDNVRLVVRPLGRRACCNLRYIVLEGKPFDLVWGQSPCIQTDVLVTRVLRGMLVWIAPAQLQGSVSTDARLTEVVSKHLGSNLYAIHVNLDAGRQSGAVISEKNVSPRVVERQWLHCGDTDRDLGQLLIRSCGGLGLSCFGFRLRLRFCLFLFLFLCL